jgi:hypothetical protein
VRPFARDVASGDGLGPPLDTFLNVREARGRLAVRQLSRLLDCRNVDESYFVDDPPLFPSPPLTWFMDGDMHYQLQGSAAELVAHMRDSSATLWDAIPEINRNLPCQHDEPDIPQCE